MGKVSGWDPSSELQPEFGVGLDPRDWCRERLSLRWLRSYDYLPLLHDTNWITLCQPLDSSISELPYKLYAIFLNIIPYYSRFSSVAIFFFNPFTEQRCFFSIVVHTLRSLVLEKKLLRTNKVKPSVVKKITQVGHLSHVIHLFTAVFPFWKHTFLVFKRKQMLE